MKTEKEIEEKLIEYRKRLYYWKDKGDDIFAQLQAEQYKNKIIGLAWVLKND